MHQAPGTVSEFLTAVMADAVCRGGGFSPLSVGYSPEAGIKHTSLAGNLENSPINHSYTVREVDDTYKSVTLLYE